MTKDNKKYLMKRRRYGWGWTPATPQGWLFFVLQIGIIFVAATSLPAKPAQPTAQELLSFFLIAGLAATNLVLIASQFGPKPHWRWGKKDTDNPDEDF